MKYNIHINQKYLAEHTNLDIKDAVLLDYLYFFCNSKNKKISEKRIRNEKGEWTWINYERIIRDMPLLGLKSKGSITNRIRNLERNGFVITWQPKNQKIYAKLEPRVDKLYANMNKNE